MNKVFLIGNLVRDPDPTENSNGTALCRFSLAVNRRTQSGEKTADFYNVTAFRGLAETIVKYCHKGDKVAVFGDIQLRNYEGNDGVKRLTVDVLVQDIEFLNQRERQSTAEQREAPAKKPASKPAPKQTSLLEDFDDDGDIPF